MNNISRIDFLLIALLLSLGLTSSGYFIGQTMYNAKIAINTAEAKGLAERRVGADLAYWNIQYTVTGDSRQEIQKLYDQSESAQKVVAALLLENGFEKSEIEPGVIDYVRREFRDEDQKLVEEKHLLVGSIDVATNKVQLVSKVRAKLNKLIAQGLDIKNNAPTYHFTKLNEIKPDMLKEATKNARIAANEFAANAGVEVGGIRNAKQGSFIIRDVGKNYGDTKKIEKDVRVVTNITFYLTR